MFIREPSSTLIKENKLHFKSTNLIIQFCVNKIVTKALLTVYNCPDAEQFGQHNIFMG